MKLKNNNNIWSPLAPIRHNDIGHWSHLSQGRTGLLLRRPPSLLSNIMLSPSINHWTLTSRLMISKAMLNEVISYQCRHCQRQPFWVLLVIRVIKYRLCFRSKCFYPLKLPYKGNTSYECCRSSILLQHRLLWTFLGDNIHLHMRCWWLSSSMSTSVVNTAFCTLTNIDIEGH